MLENRKPPSKSSPKWSSIVWPSPPGGGLLHCVELCRCRPAVGVVPLVHNIRSRTASSCCGMSTMSAQPCLQLYPFLPSASWSSHACPCQSLPRGNCACSAPSCYNGGIHPIQRTVQRHAGLTDSRCGYSRRLIMLTSQHRAR